MKAPTVLIVLLLAIPLSSSAQDRYEMVSYGDLVHQDNGLAGTGYQSHFALNNNENRLLWFDRSRVTRLRPYIKTSMSFTEKNISVENTFTYGIGAEVRPLAHNNALANSLMLDWLTRTRFYTEYLGQSFVRGANPSWNPRQDFLLGFDIWREYGAADENRASLGDRMWAELFVGAAFHNTGFYLRNYDSVQGGLNVRVGGSSGRGNFPVMPYLVVDAEANSRHSFFWQNRSWGGVGLRTQHRLNNSWKLKVFAEKRWVLGYLKDRPLASDGVPWSDVVLGMSFQYNRY